MDLEKCSTDTAPWPAERLHLGSTDYRARHTYGSFCEPDGKARSGIPPDPCRMLHFGTPLAFQPTYTRCHTLDIRDQLHRNRCRKCRMGFALAWLEKSLNIRPNTIQSPPKAATSKFGYALSGSLLPLTFHTESRLPNIRHLQP